MPLTRMRFGLHKLQNMATLQNTYHRNMSAINSPSETIPAAVDSVTKTVVTVLPEYSWYNVTGHYQVLLDTVQVSSGLPWWAVLLGTGVVVRSLLVPVNVMYEKKLVNNLPHVAALSKLKTELQQSYNKGDHVVALTKKGEIDFYKKVNNFSWKKSANWFLLPSICIMSLNFISIRGLAELSYQPLHDTTFLWVPSLCQNDPYFLLPAVNAAAVAYVFKYGIDTGSENPLSQLLSSNKALMAMMLVMGGIQSMFPSALVLYWFASNIFGMAVIKPLMNNERSRSKMGLLSLEEKKQAFKVLPTVQDIVSNANENYQNVREAGHNEDFKSRKAKLAKLEMDDGSNVEELRASLDKLNLELKRKDEELSKLKEETEEQIQFLKNSEEFQRTKKSSTSTKVEQAE